MGRGVKGGGGGGGLEVSMEGITKEGEVVVVAEGD